MNTATVLGSIQAHLATYDLPEPWSVSANARAIYGRAVVSVQLPSGPLPVVASMLLAWADTLTDISAEAWRVPDGSSTHLTIHGRLADGTTVSVFDGVEHHRCFRLDEDERRSISLACLREWSAFDEGVAA
jgi:hypothetical protein